MASARSLVSLSSRAALLLLLVALAAQTQVARSQLQTCTNELNALNVCAPFVVPGANATPNAECCAALQGVEHDCICSTLRIASRLPVMCNLQPANCGDLNP